MGARARPLIEVLTVNIYFPRSWPCQVYGEISLYDEDSEQTYKLYERDIEHPELFIGSGQALLLTGPDNPLALAMPKPVICVRLMIKGKGKGKDHYDDSLFISGKHRLDNTTKDDCEAFRFCRIQGQGGVFLRVNYAAMASAVVAQVCIALRKKEQDSLLHCFGYVMAHYGKTYGQKSQPIDIPAAHILWTRVLWTEQNESIPLDVNLHGDVYFKLTKRFVAVPAYSSLIFKVDLKEHSTNKQILHGTCDLAPSPNVGTTKSALDNLTSDYACLFVSWFGVPELQPSPVINRPLQHYKLAGWRDSESLLEVYSVFIGRDDDAELSISGKIKVRHGSHYPCIYHREFNNADKLVKGKKLLSITGPCSPAEVIAFYEKFCIHLHLSDASGRFLVDFGAVNFHSGMAEVHNSLYNKLLCSVIQGDGGYCAVHYTPFREAVRLQIKCVVSYKARADVAKVYGSIRASYDMFDYTFEYDRKYFRRVLFDKPAEDNVEILRRVISKQADRDQSCCSDERQVAFSTSYVAMPVDCALLIDVDVYVSSHLGRGPAEHFERSLRYVLVDEEIPPMEIRGEEFDILVYAKMMPRVGD